MMLAVMLGWHYADREKTVRCRAGAPAGEQQVDQRVDLRAGVAAH